MASSNQSSPSSSVSKRYKVSDLMIKSRPSLWKALDSICPLRLAGSWDNVGPLIDPPVFSSQVHRLPRAHEEVPR